MQVVQLVILQQFFRFVLPHVNDGNFRTGSFDRLPLFAEVTQALPAKRAA